MLQKFYPKLPFFFSNCLARFFFLFPHSFSCCLFSQSSPMSLSFLTFFFTLPFLFERFYFFAPIRRKNPSFIFFEGEKLGFSCVDDCDTRFQSNLFFIGEIRISIPIQVSMIYYFSFFIFPLNSQNIIFIILYVYLFQFRWVCLFIFFMKYLD